MKKVIFICFVLISLIDIYSQSNSKPLFYLNSKQINLEKTYINVLRIDSMNIRRETLSGEVFVYSRYNEFSFYTLTDILENYTDIKEFDDSCIFKINGELIEDTTSIIIDDTYFIYVTVDKLDKIEYISQQFHQLKIISVDLETEERKPTIYIRGYDEIIDKLKNK